MSLSNLFGDIPAHLPSEVFSPLLQAGNIRIERIVSHGHASRDGFWYDQDENEWVIVLKGAARMRVEGQEPVSLRAGDFLHIPAHARHRVEWTTPEEPTVWLAVHYREPS